MKNVKNIFWGVLFILGACTLIIGRLGYLDGLNFWSILISIGLVGVLIDGIADRGFGRILFSIAFLIIVHDELLGMEALTPWTVLGAAFLGMIGLNMIFPQKKILNHIHKDWQGETNESVIKNDSGETLNYTASFGEAVKYVNTDSLRRANLKCSFGSLVVYFDNAFLKNNTADVVIENAFGSTVLYIPSDWKVVLNVNTTLGATEEKGHCNPSGTNTLHIHGTVSFGALEIKYI